MKSYLVHLCNTKILLLNHQIKFHVKFSIHTEYGSYSFSYNITHPVAYHIWQVQFPHRTPVWSGQLTLWGHTRWHSIDSCLPDQNGNCWRTLYIPLLSSMSCPPVFECLSLVVWCWGWIEELVSATGDRCNDRICRNNVTHLQLLVMLKPVQDAWPVTVVP